MANSIKEYPAVASALHTYTTPAYLNVTDIKVYVDDVLQTEGYVINGEALNFTNGYLPQADQTVRIERVSQTDSRSVDYTDGSLLNAETLDKDATQIFHVAQEAYDQARVTNMASGKFYYSQIEPPPYPEAGTLWYNKSKTPNVLEIYDGNEWYAAAPLKTNVVLTKATGSDYSHFTEWTDINFNQSTEVYLNGVLQVKAPDGTDLHANPELGDYTLENQEFTNNQGVVEQIIPTLTMLTVDAADVIVLVSQNGGYATEITEKAADMTELYATFVNQHDTIKPQMDRVEALDIDNKIVTMAGLESDTEGHKDAALISANNAAQSAADAHNSAFISRDTLEGWTAIDNETISTTSSNDPILYSSTNLTLKADNEIIIDGTLNLSGDVVVNSISQPIVCGRAWVADFGIYKERWDGSPDVTVTSVSQGKIRISHPDFVGADVSVLCTYQKNSTNTEKVIHPLILNTSGYVEIECKELLAGGNYSSVDSGFVVVQAFIF